MKRYMIALLTLTIFGALLAGCASAPSNSSTTNATNTATTNAANTTKTNTATTNTATTNTASTTGGSETKIGVAECDEYLAKYENCVNAHVPEANRATFKSAMESARSSYRQAAATAQGKTSLAQVCKSALETSKQSLAAYKCEW